MNDKQQLIFTCRFGPWGGENNDQYPAFGVKYLITIPTQHEEEAKPGTCELCGEPMKEGEEMFKYHGSLGDCPKPPLKRKTAEEKEIEQFKELYKTKIGEDFKGEILLVEESSLVLL